VRQFDVVVASHGGLAGAMLEAAGMICGAQDGARAVDLRSEDSPESFAERLAAAVDPTRDTLILTDLFGGTPNNVAAAYSRDGAVRCISGANLGLLIEALTAAEPLGDALVERLVNAGRESVVDVSSRLVTKH